ncbi:protein kinase [Eggerthellaceae bacterium zg-887]|uniref:protein kinase domain-containing protein n=1 Tax=Xiamenia xianingshaonis TaxID=2682776 RepID=UPI00140922F8|nr:serine/threonine protein kinase [Xiamenia xianingshaonis]NHM16522.1 protein kinase [Xiamenia xianingshaonis]
MPEGILSRSGAARVDEYGNVHFLRKELSRGGQGVVYRTKDPDLAIKQPIDPETGEIDSSTSMQAVFKDVRMLPIPEGIRVALPLSILRDEPGYVMRLLRDMKPFDDVFYLKGDAREELRRESMPSWLSEAEPEQALPLLHYQKAGSTKSRLIALAGCAAVLGRLHANGLVYCDLSPNNVFVDSKTNEVWLIDADNLRFEQERGGATVYTPRYGSPEVSQELDASRSVSDCWAFAVLAFEMLTLNHPFIGKRVLEPDADCGWDSDTIKDAEALEDLDEQAYAGRFPFVDDEDDDSNEIVGNTGLPLELVITPMLRWMFRQTLGYGRLEPHRRITADLWAMAMMQAYDHSLVCRECGMSFFDYEDECPYCEAAKPRFVNIESDTWDMVVQEGDEPVFLPSRLTESFDLQGFDDKTDYCVQIDFDEEAAKPVRGYAQLPSFLRFSFSEEGR